ncbi:MAG: ThiF family adenylyltransferase [Pseudomonadota bacterium]
MTRHTFTILEKDQLRLRELLLRDGREHGALMLCGRSTHVDPWTGEQEERALVREIVDVGGNAFIERSPRSMTWTTDALYHLAKRSMVRDEAICIAHSHPVGQPVFSQEDNVADRESFEIVFGRVESARPHFSLVMGHDGEFAVRGYGSDLKPHPVALTRIIGDRWSVRYPGRSNGVAPLEFDRQARAFGATSVVDLTSLRIGIAGCGGTGSAVAMLLARIGAGRLVLFDRDRVERSNISRLHLSRRADAIARRLKVDVLTDSIAEIGVAQSVVAMPYSVDEPECRDAVRACDVIFGCTDDHLGRNFLNRLAHFYLIPVIDLGVLIEPNANGGYDTFDGRVTVVQPGYACQVCRKLIETGKMREEALIRHDPALFEQQRRAGYVRGSAEPNPVVVTFTTETASMAVNELLHRLTGFRGPDGACSERVRRFDEVKDTDTIPGGRSVPSCKLCARRVYDARGDMTPFLDQA